MKDLIYKIDGKEITHEELVRWCNRNLSLYDKPHDGIIRELHIKAYKERRKNEIKKLEIDK